MEILQGWIVSYGYVSLIGLLMLGMVGAPFPDDLILLFAGVSKLRLPVFALFAYTGGLLWSITMISMGYILGEQWAVIADYSIYQVLLFLFVGLAFFGAYLLNRRRLKQECAVPVTSPLDRSDHNFPLYEFFLYVSLDRLMKQTAI